MEAFISWTGRDRDVKNVLVEKLRAAGISCWDSDEYCTSAYSQECIHAIKRCGLFIVIVSDASMEKGYVINEIITARKQEEAGQLNMLVYKITDAPYTDEFEFQLNHLSFVSGNAVQRQESLRGDSGIDTIVARALRLLQLRRDGQPEKPFRVKLPQVKGRTLTGTTGYFVENSRDDVLEAIERGFQQGNVIVLTEFIGFGKRTVIRKYLAQHPGQFSHAQMVDNQWGSLRNFLLSGLEFTNLNPALFEGLEGDALIEAKLRQLEKLDGGMLLVIPDLELPEDRELYRRLLSLRCRIILLTQGSAESCYDLLPVIRVGKMEDGYLTQLFFHHYTRALESDMEQLKGPLENFFDQIGGHTKTVELTASVLNRDMAVMPTDMPAYLSLRGVDGMALKDRILSQISQIFVMEQLSPGQLRGLLVAACLAVPYLSEQSFRLMLEQCGGADWQEILELDNRRWLDLDLKNGTVAMEPLIAQIVLQRAPDKLDVLQRCLAYLTDAYARQFSISDSSDFLVANTARIEHFFRIVGLTEMAEVLEALKLALQGQSNRQGLSDAIDSFQSAYPAAHYSADPGEQEFPDGESSFIYSAQHFVRTMILPLAKLRGSEFGSLWTDYSAGSRRVMEQFSDQISDITLDMESLLGMSREEFKEFLEYQRQVHALEGSDADEVYALFVSEAISMVDALFQRDHRGMLLSMENLLRHLEETPDLLDTELLADIFLSSATSMTNIYLSSKNYVAAVRLCQKAMAYPNGSRYRVALTKNYIKALHFSDQYDAALWEAFEQLHLYLEENGQQIFENRRELLLDQQQWRFYHALCLAEGGRGADALREFARGCKGEILLPNDMVKTGWEIGSCLIRSGEFEAAREFLAQYFPESKRLLLAPLCEEEACGILTQMGDLLALDDQVQNAFEADADPERHISYYHSYSRKNNSLLDRKYCTVAERAMEFDFEDLTDEEIALHAQKLRSRSSREDLLRLAPEAFALVSEAGFRVLGYRHHYVQYMGAAAMADGKIAEILNGEGKTYTIPAVAFLQWVFRRKVYVVDESPYLTQRNHGWMQGVYSLLGMESCYAASYRDVEKQPADVYYITLREMMFAYLSNELDASAPGERLKLDVAIIDEIDTVLVDEAKQWFSISSTEKDREALLLHQKAWHLAEQLDMDGEYFFYRDHRVTLLPAIYPKMEQVFRLKWSNLDQLPQIQRIESLVASAILCRFFYEENRDYFIHKGMPVWEDRNRGTFAAFNPTQQYFLCLLKGLDTTAASRAIDQRNCPRNAVCVRDLFAKFRIVCGTTATAVSFAKEFKALYNLDYVAVPPHSPVIRKDTQSPLYVSTRAKDRAILEMVAEKQQLGQPVLLITQSIAESEKYHKLLRRAGIDHRLLNAKNADEAANILSTAGMPGSVLVANALVSRGADIRLGGNPERQTLQTLVEMGTDISGLEEFLYRLPTPEQKESELYKKYYSILEQNKRLAARQRKEVEALGGLCVIGTGFFPEPRTEQQTRGRCGRQGAVGESRVFRSMEDPGLTSLLSPALIEMVLGTLGELEEVDGMLLSNALKKAQKRLHEANFAGIRNIHTSARYLEKYRKDFIGLCLDLRSGAAAPEEALALWAKDPFLHQQLQLLQQGQEQCESPALNILWKQGGSLRSAKGMRVARALEEAFRGELDRRFASLPEEERERMLAHCLNAQLLDAWEQYIEALWDVSKSLNEANMEKFLEQERSRLFRIAVEDLMRLHLRNQ